MPKITLEINETEKNLNRPILLQVVEDVRNMTDFPLDAKCYYKASAKQVVNNESIMDNDNREGIDFSHKDRIIVTGDLKYSDHAIYAGQPYKKAYNPILLDKELNIALSPINYEVDVETNLTFISKDRLTLEKWRTNLRRKIGQSIKAYQHRIDYTYPINYVFIKTLYHLYETRGLMINNTETFLEWIKRISLEKITGITNQIGEGLLAIVEQSQIGVVGIWNLTDIPKIDKLDTGDVYQAELNYIVRYSQPSILTLEYPIILNNSIVSPEYRTPCDFNYPLVFGTPEKLVWGLQSTLNDYPRHYPSEPLILPCFDEWRPKKIPIGTATIYQALIVVDPKDPTYIMNLINLGEDYCLAEWVKEMLEEFHSDSIILGASPILVSFYRNDSWSEYELLSLSDDMKLHTKEPLCLFNEYHVRLALYTDITLLTEKTIGRLQNKGLLTNELLKTLGPEYLDRIPDILSDGSLNHRELWNFIALLKETNHSFKNNNEVRRFTVGSCLISTRRITDAVSN